MEVAGEAATGTQAIRLTRQERPDLVLMDVRMPAMDGIEATARICGSPETAEVRVLILTMFDLDRYVYGAVTESAAPDATVIAKLPATIPLTIPEGETHEFAVPRRLLRYFNADTGLRRRP